MTQDTTDSDQPHPERNDISRDETFEILRNSRRRQMLRFLDALDQPVAVRKLATYIAAEEEGTTPDSVSQKYYKRVHTASLQTHLPKLDNAGVVEHNKEERTVKLTEIGVSLLPYIEYDVSQGWIPVDIFESPTSVTVVADLPGFDRSDIKLEAEEDQLHIAAGRSIRDREDETRVRHERPVGVQRTLRLPSSVLVSNPSVTFDEGVLSLEFTKHSGDRRVEIDL